MPQQKEPQQISKKLHELRLCDMCARDVHNLTKRAQTRQWGGRPSFFLPSHHFFLPPPLHHSLPASQRTSDAGVCERAQSMEHNPPTKAFQTGYKTFCQDEPDNRDKTSKINYNDSDREFRILEVVCTSAYV